jgi:Ca2+/Na+ antiporter
VSKLFRGKFVLGTKNLSYWVAVVLAAFLATLLIEVGSIALSKYKKIEFKGLKRILAFYVMNCIAFWLVARVAPYSGFGVVKFTWVLLLAAFTTLIQFFVKY